MKTRPDHVSPTENRFAHTNVRTANDAEAIALAIVDNLRCLQGKAPHHATRRDWYTAVAHAIRDRLLSRCLSTVETLIENDASTKLVAYVSAEFLTGPHLGNALVNLGLRAVTDRRWGCSGRTCPPCSSRKRSLALVTAALAGWSPATWTRSPA